MDGHPPDISFSGLTYTISQRNKEEKVLLNNVSGQVGSSRLTAILGPSGAGKTTLLKLLACSLSGGRQQGDIWAQDEIVNPAVFRQQLSVVWQNDILLPTATVREAIMTSALLRLPRALPHAQKAQRVEQILTELGLHGVKDSLIGLDMDGAMSGISGGERRRVSVGVELVTDASTLFLDEPTTGLDSEAAESLVALLAGLARSRGKTVICTIHQPSSDICALFDDLLLMANARVLYCGPWLRVDDYISNAGMNRPSHRSTAEHLLRLCKDSNAVPVLADMHERSWRLVAAAAEKVSDDGGRSLVPRLAGMASLPKPDIEAPSPPSVLQGQRSQVVLEIAARAVSGELSPASVSSSGSSTSYASSSSKPPGGTAGACARGARPPSLPFQVAVLTTRFALSWARRPASVAMQAAQFLIAALLIGAMYHKLPGTAADGEYNRVASLWFCAMVALFQSGNNALTIAYGQKALLRREAQAGHYRCSAYCLAKWATMLPLQLVYLALYTCLVYFLVGYQPLLDKFCIFSGVILLLMLISESLGMLCAGLFRTELIGSIVLQGLYVPLLMFVGFFQTHTPACFAWIKALSFATYAYSALVKNEFSGLRLTSDDGALVITDAVSIIPPNIESALTIGDDLGILLGVLVGLRLIVYAQLRISIALKWL